MPTATYPGGIWSPTTKTDKVDLVQAEHINAPQREIKAVQTELGADVAGSQTDLKTRLAVIMAASGALVQGTGFPAGPIEGQLFYRTDEDIVYIWDGSGWDSVGVFLGFAAGGDLAGSYADPLVSIPARYYEPDTACVLALAGYCNDPTIAGTYRDSSIYGNDLKIISTPPEGAGKVSQLCVDLDGSADTLTLVDGLYGDFGDCDNWSMECWVKRDSIGEQFIFENVTGLGSLNFLAGNELKMDLEVGTGEASVTSAATYTSITEWYYIVATYDITSHTLTLYVNAVSVGTPDASKEGDVDAASGDVFYIGSNGGAADWFNGKIDGFRILRRAMSATEILKRYNAFK